MLDTKTESRLRHEDWDFVEANFDALQEKYPEHWIAVMDKEVIAADPDPVELAAKLRTIDLPPNRLVIEKLTDLDVDLVTSNFSIPARSRSAGEATWTKAQSLRRLTSDDRRILPLRTTLY